METAHDKHDNKAHDKGKASAAKAVKGGFLGKGDGRMKKLTGNAMDPVGNYKIVRRRALEAEINGGWECPIVSRLLDKRPLKARAHFATKPYSSVKFVVSPT